jgi:hypothetical protein
MSGEGKMKIPTGLARPRQCTGYIRFGTGVGVSISQSTP